MVLKFIKSRRKKAHAKKVLDWVDDNVLTQKIRELIERCEFGYINKNRIFCYRSTGASTRAYARIWGLGRIWQQTLKLEPAYVIETISEKFDKVSKEQQDMILIHELLHIPKTFSGALVPHKRKGGVNDRTVREIFNNLRRHV